MNKSSDSSDNLFPSAMGSLLSIILVAPQMGENIGAAARVMKNFGFNDLRIVSPRDGWPNEKAIAMAAHAEDLVRDAKIFTNLQDAVQDLEYLYATTAIHRDLSKEHISSKDLNNQIPRNAKVGIIFGRENSGLNNAEIILANKIIVINTINGASSINLAQAICIVCYELSSIASESKMLKRNHELATKGDLHYFYQNLFSKLKETNFFRTPEKENQMQENITNIFSKINGLTKNEIQILHGIFNCLKKSND